MTGSNDDPKFPKNIKPKLGNQAPKPRSGSTAGHEEEDKQPAKIKVEDPLTRHETDPNKKRFIDTINPYKRSRTPRPPGT